MHETVHGELKFFTDRSAALPNPDCADACVGLGGRVLAAQISAARRKIMPAAM